MLFRRRSVVLKMVEKMFGLFVNPECLLIFVCYIVFCVAQGIFVTASHKEGGYSYNTVTVVLFTEIVKLCLAYVCYVKDFSNDSLWVAVSTNLKTLGLYLVPSFLYCIYNNLAFVNLSHFDPTSYFILLQFRVVVTGVIFQYTFKRKLSKMQWFSLGLLTSGCIIQQLDWTYIKSAFSSNGETSREHAFFSIYLLFIVIQTLCSCFAGVYNEHLLKDAASINIFIQNIFMYLDSIFWNLIVLTFQGNLFSTFSPDSLRSIFQPIVVAIILNNSFIGITTSLFLKSLDSILKTFASALELLFTAVLSWLLFGIEIKLNTFVAIVFVSYALYIYSQNPVHNKSSNNHNNNHLQPKTQGDTEKRKDEIPLLEDV